ncbi:MAG: putative unusual protein kinase regulating ubiquinone biosynthesis (AarF/ABC1/UbiB family) [bacterium]
MHADPNPGNYLFLNDGRIGILDFGCIKEFDEQFIERFRQLSQTLYSGSTSDVVEKMMKLNLYDGNEDPSSLHELFLEIAAGFQHFVGDGHVDFGDVSGKLFNRAYEVSIQLLKHKQFIPDHNFLFLDRTRFGLFRVFQKLKAQVNLKNPYEFDE